MDAAHRRIDVQSPADVQYLIANAAAAARSRIDLHFPPRQATTDDNTAPIDEDPLRKRVEVLVQEFLERTFASAKGNMSVNGLEGEEIEAAGMKEETEPFDHSLARRIQATTSRIEALQLQLATLRREVPSQTAGRYGAQLEEESRRWTEGMEHAEKLDAEKAGEVDIAVAGLGDVGAMQRSWELGTQRLVDVKSEVGGVQGRLERAREAVGYLASV